jgi:uncharacterized protein
MISPIAETSADVVSLQERLLELLRSLGPCVVAYSGGVDSAVVANAAALVFGGQALAVTGVSSSLASGELEAAVKLAADIGIPHLVVNTSEVDNPNYIRNSTDRCFHCKTELYTHLRRVAVERGFAVMVNGANADDVGDFRPGMAAATNFAVRSPLLECGLTKANVRELARHWGLAVSEKPATPCLSSRIAHGTEVTPQRLAMIDEAEQFLRSHGFSPLRVRYHEGDIARVEVVLSELPRLCAEPLRGDVERRLRELGFRFVTFDLAGFRSGSLNPIVPLQLHGIST